MEKETKQHTHKSPKKMHTEERGVAIERLGSKIKCRLKILQKETHSREQRVN